MRRYSEINGSAEAERDGERGKGRKEGGEGRRALAERTDREILVREGGRRARSGTKMAMRKRRARRTGRNLRFHLVARACPSDPILRWLGRGRGPRETRPPAVRVGGPLLVLLPRSARGVREGGSEDAPVDPTPFRASALLRHSRVMPLDPGDPRG